MAKPKAISDLNKIYLDADEQDKELFAEMRSNILLTSGEHYAKINKRISNQVRQNLGPSSTPTNDPKLRITKNHTHKITRTYISTILAECPGTGVLPQRDTELQDQKDAELNQAVWEDVKYRHKLKDKIRDWARDFIQIGEVAAKIFWDPMAGELVGYHQKVDEDGQPVMEPGDAIDPMTGQPQMQPAPDREKPVFKGDFCFEPLYGFNLLREAGCQDMEDKDRCWIIRKMVSTDELKARYGDNPDVVQKINESARETYVIFDASKGGYTKKVGETLLLEYYWQPCLEYPEGYYIYATKSVILEEGPLPYGIFPIRWKEFDKYQTSARGRSIVKVIRPYQAEINRASSAMATHQVTMGDDKIIYSAGSKLAPGTLLPGVRGISMQGGAAPTILPGRTGAQYLDYCNAQITEMYAAAMVDESDPLESSNGQIDAYALLFRAASRKRKYSQYIEKFESFLIEVTELILEIAKQYLPDDMLISAVGRREIVNIKEFRNTSKLNYEIKVEARDDTLETQFGKQLTFQHLIQYAGKQLDPKTLGKLVKNAPFSNWEDSFEDLTLDEDIARNEMLKLERGEQVQPTKYVEADYMAKKLTSRMKKPDFDFLPPQVQQAYQMLLQGYEQMLAMQEQKIIAAKNEFIPVDGALVSCDFYVNDPSKPEDQAKRARIPQRALEWLLQRLAEQGMSQDKILSMNHQALSDMADMILANKQGAQAQGMPQPQGQMQAA